jgi:hypothetical protein
MGNLSGKLELVKDIIVALAKHLESGVSMEKWVGLDLDRFLSHGKATLNPQAGKQKRAHYGSLFAQRDFDSKYVLLVVTCSKSKLTVAQQLERRGYLLEQARTKITQ